MRMLTSYIHAAAIAAMSSAFAAEPRYTDEKSAEPAPPPTYRMRPFKGRGGKKLASGRYKGSRWAKRASKRGGNPARF